MMIYRVVCFWEDGAEDFGFYVSKKKAERECRRLNDMRGNPKKKGYSYMIEVVETEVDESEE